MEYVGYDTIDDQEDARMEKQRKKLIREEAGEDAIDEEYNSWYGMGQE